MIRSAVNHRLCLSRVAEGRKLVTQAILRDCVPREGVSVCV